MLPLFILAIENDDDRQFVADIYTRYQPALYRKAQKVLHDNDRARGSGPRGNAAGHPVSRSGEGNPVGRAAAIPYYHRADNQHFHLQQVQAAPGNGFRNCGGLGSLPL